MNKAVGVAISVVVLFGVVAHVFVYFGSSAKAAEYEQLPVVELGQTGGVVSYVNGNNTGYIGTNRTGVQAFSFWANQSKTVLNVVVFSLYSDARITQRVNNNNFTAFSNTFTYSVNINNTRYYYTYFDVSPMSTYVINFTDIFFSTFKDAIEYFINYSSISYAEASFNVPAGYIAVALVPNDSISVDLSERMNDMSALTGSPWPNIIQYIGTMDEWPSNGDTVEVNLLSEIEWEKGDNRNLLGQTKNAIYTHTVPGYGKYYVIYNPAYYIKSLTGTDPTGINETIYVNINRAAEVRLYSVLQGAINGVETNTISDNGYTLVDNNWTDNGVPVNPEAGGGNYVPDDTDLSTVLSGLLGDIDSFFSGTWRYIRQFVTAAGKLPSMVVEMYSWLPAEFRSVIFSAFSIVMVIGILKVML